MDLSAAVDAVYGALNAHNTALSQIFIPEGKSLLFALGAALVSYKMIIVMLAGESFNEVVAETIGLVLKIGLVLFFLQSWTYVFQQSLLGGFDYISAKVSGGATAGAGITQGMTVLLRTAQSIYEGSGLLAGGVYEFVTNFPSILMANLFRLASIVVLMVVGVLYGGVLLLSQVLVGVTLLLGPLMVPWLIYEPTSFVFWGWVKALVIAALYKVFSVILISFCSTLVPLLNTAAAASSQPGVVDIAGAAVVLMIAAVMLLLVLQIPALANGIISGHLSPNFRVPRRLPSTSGRNDGAGKKD
ncbi:MAG: type IV secretion system protein [Zoogloeaceae bacterium]|nr:type IV secretion system protein [Zoogloeaceae bacterium]